MVSIKALRKSKSMTQKELAKALGISRATVSKYEAGLRTPDMDMRSEEHTSELQSRI